MTDTDNTDNNLQNEIKHKNKRQTKVLEKSFLNDENILEIGVDEAGRGPMFGRVYTAAVILPNNKDTDFNFSLMKDSKKFHSEKKLEQVANYIMEKAIAYDVQYAEAEEIDNSNILKVTVQTMTKSILNIVHKLTNEDNNFNKEFHLIIDGNYFKPIMYINKDGTSQILTYNCVEGGDNMYCNIAAASILAKYFRDKYILDLCYENPELDEKYGLKKNKGYGTVKHMEGIKTHGITQWHRKSFGICKTYA